MFYKSLEVNPQHRISFSDKGSLLIKNRSCSETIKAILKSHNHIGSDT